MAKSDDILRRVWWPTLETIEDAKGAARQGAGFAALIAVGMASVITLNLTGVTNNFLGMNGYAYIDASIFLLIAVFTYRYSRVAALAGLAVYVLERANQISETGANRHVGAILLGLLFVNGVRGTFAYHRFVSAAVQTPQTTSS